MREFLASVAVAATLTLSGAASAATYSYDISDYNPGGEGAVTGDLTLDVTAGQVTAGTLELTGGMLPSGWTEFTAVTTFNACGGTCTNWASGNGDQWSGAQNNFPLDANGVTFHTGAWGTGYVFGVYSASGTGAPYQAALFGPGGATEYWTYNDAITLTPAPAPEPATWAMLGLGFAALGLAGCRRARTLRAISL
ncbi:PEP-CTERM sorting domain-containing protein [Roseiarcus fermentans]|nr:PEP-CTERM sorting domain-containing protein [Roseiarcus fermentans]